jgi:hypothetical protein
MKIQDELKKLAARKDIWREGEYLDFWSVPHFLSGALLACLVYLFHLSFWYATLLAAVLLIAYEVFEHMIEIDETVWNRRLDVVVGLASFIPITILIFDWKFLEVFILGLCIGIPDGILSYLGWSASQKGMLFEKKVQREYETLKTKFLEKMKERKLKRQEKRAAKLALKQLKKMIKEKRENFVLENN